VRSLFLRLWLAFLLVTGLTSAASLAVSYASAVRRAGEAEQVSQPALAASAQQALTARGADGLASWTLDEVHRQPEIQVYFVDAAGHEMLNRTVHGQPIGGGTERRPPLVRAHDGTVYRVLVRRTRGIVFDFWTILFRPWVLLGLTLVISGAGCAWLAWMMSRPVTRLRASVRRVAAGDLELEIEKALKRRRDELGGLARDIQQMTRDLRTLMDSKEELLREVSHELRSPLARLRLAAELARNGTGKRTAAFRRIDREVERIDGMIGQILHFSRLHATHSAPTGLVDLSQLLEEAVEDARIEADHADVTIDLTGAAPTWVRGDSARLRSAFENVLRNALRQAPRQSRVRVRLWCQLQEIRIAFCDEGGGIEGPDLEWIFEPFRRGESSDGVGLGLAITRRIAQIHGGRVAARNLPDGGFCVELFLPRVFPPIASACVPAPETASS
jgi:two-component system sensor histidine kinase CpxA